MTSAFEDLVRKISLQERKDMLERIEKKNQINPEPVCSIEPGDNESIIPDVEFVKLPVIWQLYVLLTSFFSRKKQGDITENVLLHLLRKKIQQKIPDFFDFKRSILKPRFHSLIFNLKLAIDTFRQPILDATGQEKVEFYALLAKFEFPELYSSLQECTDPDKFISNNMSLGADEIRKNMELALNEKLSQIDNLKRNIMHKNIQALSSLNSLVRFPYMRILNFFPPSAGNGVSHASMRATRGLILELSDLIYNFRSPPSIVLLEALFIFSIKEELDEDEKKIEKELSGMIIKAQRALEDIRKINSKIPWSDLVKAVSGNIHHGIGSNANTEDWYAIFKNFWRNVQESAIKKWLDNKQIKAYIDDLLLTWKMASLPMLSGYRSSEYPDNIHLRFEFTMAALLAMFTFISNESLYHALNLVRIDGRFYKRSNRKEFEEVLDSLTSISSRLQSLQSRLNFDGELGITNLKIRQTYKKKELTKQMMNFVEKIDDECHSIVLPVIADLKTLCNLLSGILEGNQGRYDTLSNFSEIGGQSNKVFRQNLQQVHATVSKSTQILKNLFYLEEQRQV